MHPPRLRRCLRDRDTTALRIFRGSNPPERNLIITTGPDGRAPGWKRARGRAVSIRFACQVTIRVPRSFCTQLLRLTRRRNKGASCPHIRPRSRIKTHIQRGREREGEVKGAIKFLAEEHPRVNGTNTLVADPRPLRGLLWFGSSWINSAGHYTGCAMTLRHNPAILFLKWFRIEGEC